MSRPDVLVADRYRLVERIAAGGMGSVWEAWDERLHRRVALKQLHPQPGLSKAEAQLATNRAMREARITARLHHAHAVPVYDVVDFEGQPCLIMQYLPSKSLQRLLAERGVLEVDEVARIGSEVASALAAAHQAGIVHRDVKPGNVLIGEDGSAKLTDFGISHALGDVTLTSTGMVTGTPAFLAPEVARGIESGFASDVFSLGSTLYAALEGTPPFGTGENPMATLHRVASGEISPPQRSGPLTGELRRMLSVDPAQRPSMREAAATLAAISARTESGADGTTERFAGPMPSGPPPSRTMTLPAANPDRPQPTSGPPVGPPPPVRRPVAAYADPPPPAERPHRNRTTAAIALLGLLLLAGLVVLLVSQLGGNNTGTGTAAGSTSPKAPATTPRSSSSTRSTTRAASSRAASSSASSSRSASSPAPTTSASATTKANGNGNGSKATQLSQAVTSYYALLPGNTDAAWSRLTPAFQQDKAGGRSQYDQFWGGFSAVSTSNVSADAKNDTVTATVTYTRQDGSTTSETDTFGLITQDGVLKINSQG